MLSILSRPTDYFEQLIKRLSADDDLTEIPKSIKSNSLLVVLAAYNENIESICSCLWEK